MPYIDCMGERTNFVKLLPMFTTLAIALAFAVTPITVSAADFDDGLAAFNRKDYVTALKIWRPLADRGEARPQYDVGLLYFHGLGVERDVREAARWFRLAADQGYAPAQSYLGAIYRSGNGVEQDPFEARKWFARAAAQGDAFAQNWLGALSQLGQGGPINLVEAARWYRLAAEQGNSDGQTNLGYLYLQGQGLQTNRAEAERWFRKAAAQGNARATAALAELSKSTHPAPSTPRPPPRSIDPPNAPLASPDGGPLTVYAVFYCVSAIGIPSGDCDFVEGHWYGAALCKSVATTYNNGRATGPYVCMARRTEPAWQEVR